MTPGMNSADPINKSLLLYIISKRPNSGLTELMKLCYLIDLTSVKKKGEQVSKFTWLRYTYGPFDPQIYSCLESLVADKLIIGESRYSDTLTEYFTYKLNDDTKVEESFNESQRKTINEVLQAMEGYSAKTLTSVAYKTKPMKALGATLGGSENIGVKLNLKAD